MTEQHPSQDPLKDLYTDWSEIMAAIYSRILEKLKRERYPVFSKRCRLSKLHKVWILGSHLIKARFSR